VRGLWVGLGLQGCELPDTQPPLLYLSKAHTGRNPHLQQRVWHKGAVRIVLQHAGGGHPVDEDQPQRPVELLGSAGFLHQQQHPGLGCMGGVGVKGGVEWEEASLFSARGAAPAQTHSHSLSHSAATVHPPNMRFTMRSCTDPGSSPTGLPAANFAIRSYSPAKSSASSSAGTAFRLLGIALRGASCRCSAAGLLVGLLRVRLRPLALALALVEVLAAAVASLLAALLAAKPRRFDDDDCWRNKRGDAALLVLQHAAAAATAAEVDCSSAAAAAVHAHLLPKSSADLICVDCG